MSSGRFIQTELLCRSEVSISHVRPTGMRGCARRQLIEGVRER